ncbi:alpha/beta-hydrolase [Acephala macrosclerotiorum]|nr:alpha/beta-hydrolase [Acephala macrosclerotiorum]
MAKGAAGITSPLQSRGGANATRLPDWDFKLPSSSTARLPFPFHIVPQYTVHQVDQNTMMLYTLLLFTGFGVCANYTGRQDTPTGTDIFIGIPYAQPPTGALRLAPPLPIVLDLGTLNVSGPLSNRCHERKAGSPSSSLTGSEDCLALDIIRPAQGDFVQVRSTTTTTKLLPVYIFIHGGNFNDGDKSDYDGRYLVQTSVQLRAPFIFVAINYQLSFLSFPSSDASF